MISDETFFAWLDGELGADEAERIAAEVAADPELASRAAQHRKMQARFKRAFDPIAEAAVPAQLTAAIGEPERQVVDFAEAKRSRAARRASMPQWAALAATLAVGIFAGTMVPHRSDAPVRADGGKLYAAAALDDALTTQLASAPAGGVRIGLTFRDRSGTICRSFTAQASSGLACRSDGHWQLRGLFAAPEGQSSDYRMAAGMDPNLAALVDSSLAGEPLDAAQEKAARQSGWR